MSNNPKQTTLTVDVGDIPLIAEALQHQVAYELCVGNRAGRERAKALLASIDVQVPAAAKFFAGATWAVIVAVIRAGGKPEVSYHRPDYMKYADYGYIQVRIGDAVFNSEDWRHPIKSDHVDQVREILEQYRPMPD